MTTKEEIEEEKEEEAKDNKEMDSKDLLLVANITNHLSLLHSFNFKEKTLDLRSLLVKMKL